MSAQKKEKMTLKQLSSKFLVSYLKESRAKFKLIKNAKRFSQNDEKHKLDFLIIDAYTNEEIGVKCKDWNRSVSVNIINSFIREIKQLRLSSGILIGRRFSDSARNHAEATEKLDLITKGRMITWMRQHGIDFSI